jgi:hypothetical protein
MESDIPFLQTNGKATSCQEKKRQYFNDIIMTSAPPAAQIMSHYTSKATKAVNLTRLTRNLPGAQPTKRALRVRQG